MSVTPQQQRAIEARGRTIVSASAGSGKTHVMVSRLIELIKNNGADVSEMLAVTFTNKAAAQMRDRIRRSLLDEVRAAEPDARRRLKEQIAMLPLADICTIHAFCGRLIRTYFYLVDVDPAFRIVGTDDAEGQALSARALERTFEEAYAAEGTQFSDLLAVYFRKKKDSRLKDMVRSLYADVRGEADYIAILERIAAGEEDLFEEAAATLAEEYRRRARGVLSRAQSLRSEIAGASPKLQDYYGAILDAANAVVGATDLFKMCAMLEGFALPTSPRRTQKTEPEVYALITKLQRMAGEVKEIYGAFKGYHARDVELARYESARQYACGLAVLVLAYDSVYSELKREAGVLDYGDLEHLALRILSMPEAQDALAKRYKFVFVDEYQDVNPMQERILSALAKQDVFLVGDKKQAIYGFRGSKSRFFTEKAEQFRAKDNSLELSVNFRSAKGILDAVNTVFRAALPGYSEMDGGVLYPDYPGEVHVYDLPVAEQETTERGVYSVRAATTRSTQNPIARRVAAIIEEECGRKEHLGKQWFDVGLVNPDGTKGGLRDVHYGDIAVLVRKNTKAAGAIVNAISERGIPVTASAEVNICEYFEVRLLIDWLSYLDNAEQDIPMASAMLSVLGGFNDRELALIRLKIEKVHRRYKLAFRAACRAYVECYREGNDPICKKLEAFYARVERYRSLARIRTAPEMLALLLAEGLEAQIAAKGDSAGRLARVRRLLAESENCGSIHAFLHRLKDCNYSVDFSETGGENAVRVLTMHASKGLEFPVVILTELDMDFRGPDYDEVMWTDKFHIAPRCFDLEKRVYFDTIIRKAAALYLKRETIEGERNLLYVGMTRACCRLHMIFEDGAPQSEDEFSYAPDDAKRLSDFIPRMQFISENLEEEPVFERVERRSLEYRLREEIVQEIVAAGRPYAFEESTRVPVKDSATGLMKKNNVPMYRGDDAEYDDTVSEIEADVSDMAGVYSADIGTAYHAFLEHVIFGNCAAEELARMANEGVVTAEQLALLDEDKLASILAIPYFAGLTGKKLHRELKFLVSFPASDFAEVYAGTQADDNIIFQGAIDLLVEEGDGRYTVVDYKFSSLGDGHIREKYAVQMKLYRKAVSKIMHTAEANVHVRILNIARGREIEI